jgi:hypothetical protein
LRNGIDRSNEVDRGVGAAVYRFTFETKLLKEEANPRMARPNGGDVHRLGSAPVERASERFELIYQRTTRKGQT